MEKWKKTFFTIWAGQIFSTLSSVTVGYAVIFWLSIKTESAEVLALASLATLLPQLILGPFIGVFIDRLDRRTVMIAADLFIAICTAVIAFLFSKDIAGLHWFYLLMMFRSIGSAFHIPAMQASIPLLAPKSELMRVSGVNQMIQSSSIIAGPPLAALLINTFNMSSVLLVDVVGAAIACITLLAVQIPIPQKKENPSVPHIFLEMKEGFLEIYNRKGLFMLFLFSIAGIFFIIPIATLFPLLTINHFKGGAYQVSIIEIFWGLGMLLGGGVLSLKKFNANKIILINLMYVVLGLSFAFSGILPDNAFWGFMFLTLIGGVSMTVYSGTYMVILQTSIDPSALGRVFSIQGSVSLLPSIMGLMYTGYAAERLGVPMAFVIAGFALVLLGISSFFVPPIRELIQQYKEEHKSE